ncbi:MAG: hypothetical protein RBR64_09175, partial [Bacteroidales bacterium]|nr:hypothetical protein [Bacteroidales bacterium]
DAWDSKIATYNKRSGNRQTYQERFIPHTQMEMPQLAGSIISIDDRQPPFWYDKGKRMWFYIGIDIASRAVTTFVYGKSKTGIILDFYRQMVRNYHELGLNLPAELEAESALNSSFKNTFLQEGKMFKHVKIHANNARGKYIERVFGKVRYGIEKKSPGFIARPFARFEHNQSGPNSNKIIPYDDLVLARLKDLEDYNNQPHPTEPGVSRWEYFLNNQDPNLPPTNYAAIIPYLGRKTETSCKAGYVKLSNSKRALAMDGKILTGAELINAMRQIEGKNIDVYWLDANDGSIIKAYAFHKGRMVCELMEMPKFNRSQNERTAQDREAESLQMSYINTVIGFAKTQAAQIDDLGIIDNTPKPKRLFKINNVERYEATEDYYDVEVVDEINEDDEEILYNPSTGHDYEADKERWKKQFIDQTL